ncbi:MAG: tetratricopeptide repeat protein [Pyrinomonadaceae bacterium]
MPLRHSLKKQLEEDGLSPASRALLRCRVAGELISSGKYADAAEALGEFWQGAGERPAVAGFEDRIAAEVLLQCGTLTGWVGESEHLEGAQENAKDLICESKGIFERLSESEKTAEAETELGYCYWRLGEYDNARVVLEQAIEHFGQSDGEMTALAHLRLAIVEATTKHYERALEILNSSSHLFERDGRSDALRGKFYVNRATVLKNIEDPTKKETYTDLALLDYAAASYHFDQAGHKSYRAAVENQLGLLHHARESYGEAHGHLNLARSLFVQLRDRTHVAQVDEAICRVFISEREYFEAEEVGRSAVVMLERSEARGLLAEALISLGTAEARNGRTVLAKGSFTRAAEIASLAGERDMAASAHITLLEELLPHLDEEARTEHYDAADSLLRQCAPPALLDRLRICAKTIITTRKEAKQKTTFVTPDAETIDWPNFTLTEVLRQYQRSFVERALEEGGSVTRAAQLLGFKHHNSLNDILKRRGKELSGAAPPVKKRKRLPQKTASKGN